MTSAGTIWAAAEQLPPPCPRSSKASSATMPGRVRLAIMVLGAALAGPRLADGLVAAAEQIAGHGPEQPQGRCDLLGTVAGGDEKQGAGDDEDQRHEADGVVGPPRSRAHAPGG